MTVYGQNENPMMSGLNRLSGSRVEFGEANTSLWHWTLRDSEPLPRPSGSPGNCDVAIIGGGLTALWTAYSLIERDPTLKIQVLEANKVAFGASGRAGGWAIATLDGQHAYLKDLSPVARAAAVKQVASTLDVIERVTRDEAISCGYHKGGMVRIAARHSSQSKVLEAYRKKIEAENGGVPIGEYMGAHEAAKISPMTGAFGAVTFPHCAVVNPAQLAYGLARALIRRGVPIFENCKVQDINQGHVVCELGKFEAGTVVPALEGYSGLLTATEDRILPVYSHVIATEPLSPALRESIGLADRQAFADCSSISTYGQVTEDNRLVLGALASYPYSSRLGTLSDQSVRSRYASIYAIMLDLWPQLQATAITHAWSGALGVPRGFRPAVIEDRQRRLVWGGGYVARGVANSCLFGQTMAELILRQDTPRTRCPWVFRNSNIDEPFPKWEPEPLKWLGIMAATGPGRLTEAAVRAAWLPERLRSVIIAAASAAEAKR